MKRRSNVGVRRYLLLEAGPDHWHQTWATRWILEARKAYVEPKPILEGHKPWRRFTRPHLRIPPEGAHYD